MRYALVREAISQHEHEESQAKAKQCAQDRRPGAVVSWDCAIVIFDHFPNLCDARASAEFECRPALLPIAVRAVDTVDG